MGWERVEPQRGARVSHRAQVTCAWRAPRGSSKSGKLAVTIGSEAGRLLGWKARDHVSMDIDRAAGTIRLTACAADSGWALAAKKTSGVMELELRLDYMTGPKHAATPVVHRTEGASLVLKLPSWALETARPVAAPSPGVTAAAAAAEAARKRLLADPRPPSRRGVMQ